MELTFKHTSVFTKNLNAYLDPSIRFVVDQGGTRSSKTYSLCQLLIYICLTTPGIMVSIARKSFPALRGSVMRDVLEILQSTGLYNEKNHNKSNNIYTFPNRSTIEFISIDESQKMRGRKRDILFINEANELDYEEFLQLVMRTSTKMFIDFNPSEMEHWIYNLLDDPKAVLIKSTFYDNPFLPNDQREDIIRLIQTDQNYYRIYVLGERPISNSRIYSHFKEYTEEPHPADIVSVNYGLDFGYNHPSALIKVVQTRDKKYYVKELLYSSGLTTTDLIRILDTIPDLRREDIWCDYSRPEIIQELTRAGYRAKNAVKEVKEGISTVKSNEILLHRDSINTWKEYRLYSWKTIGEAVIDEPVKLNDDAMDAIRYAIHSSKSKKFNPYTTKIY